MEEKMNKKIGICLFLVYFCLNACVSNKNNDINIDFQELETLMIKLNYIVENDLSLMDHLDIVISCFKELEKIMDYIDFNKDKINPKQLEKFYNIHKKIFELIMGK
jgi:hypothetical protein